MTTEELLNLRGYLKSGAYDGTHIMQAWIAIEELLRLRVEIDNLKKGEFICHTCALRKDSEGLYCDF